MAHLVARATLALASRRRALQRPHTALGLLEDDVRGVVEQPDAADSLARAQALQVAQERDRVQAQQELSQRAQSAQVCDHLRTRGALKTLTRHAWFGVQTHVKKHTTGLFRHSRKAASVRSAVRLQDCQRRPHSLSEASLLT